VPLTSTLRDTVAAEADETPALSTASAQTDMT
jgi:hypothetical protein